MAPDTEYEPSPEDCEVVAAALERLGVFALKIEGSWRASPHGLIMPAEECVAKQYSRADRIRLWWYGCPGEKCLRGTVAACERRGCQARDLALAVKDSYRVLCRERILIVEKVAGR